MIVAYLQGGLGNQLFQYAFGRYLSHKHCTDLLLDLDWFSSPRPGETIRSLDLVFFQINASCACEDQQERWKKYRSRYVKYFSFFQPLRLIREASSRRIESFKSSPDNSYLFGFWQSETFFLEIRHLLLSELIPSQALDHSALLLDQEMQASQSISIHVRRGDYVSSKSASAFHGTCSLAYYQQAIQLLSDRFDNPVFYIFSDDIDWCRNNLVFRYPSIFVPDFVASKSWQDLWLLSRCKNHIIANSSFSWWGAWLSQNPDKVVVAPRQWFASRSLPAELLPKSWIKI